MKFGRYTLNRSADGGACWLILVTSLSREGVRAPLFSDGGAEAFDEVVASGAHHELWEAAKAFSSGVGGRGSAGQSSSFESRAGSGFERNIETDATLPPVASRGRLHARGGARPADAVARLYSREKGVSVNVSYPIVADRNPRPLCDGQDATRDVARRGRPAQQRPFGSSVSVSARQMKPSGGADLPGDPTISAARGYADGAQSAVAPYLNNTDTSVGRRPFPRDGQKIRSCPLRRRGTASTRRSMSG
jgi:hypothetical protein